jgi:hypothetical protein
MAKNTLSMVRDNRVVRIGDQDAHPRQSPLDGPRKIIKMSRIGNPPDYFDERMSAIWLEIREVMPWLRENHRAVFELYVRMIAKSRFEFDSFTARDAGIMIRCADRLGGNPVSDQYFEHEQASEQDEFFDI